MEHLDSIVNEVKAKLKEVINGWGSQTIVAAYEQLVEFLPSAYKEVCFGMKRADDM